LNPYEPSQVTDLTQAQQHIPEYIPKPEASIGWIIMREWFGLLWIYYGVMAIVVGSFWLTDMVRWREFDYGWALGILNAVYFSGPLIEWAACRDRQRRVPWGTELFAILLVVGIFILLALIVISMLKGFEL